MPQCLKDILEGMGPSVGICKLLALWPKAVDSQISKKTEPIKIKNKTLYVLAASSAWANELNFLKAGIIEKFNQQAGTDAIKDIKFSS